MTGHGVGVADAGRGRIIVEARAVNHRFLDVRVRLPRETGDLSTLIETYVRKTLERGRIEVTVRSEGDAYGAPSLDADRARHAYAQLVSLRDELCPNESVPLSLLASLPDLFAVASGGDSDATRQAIEQATAAACDELQSMRAREGFMLAHDLIARLESATACLSRVEERAPEVVMAYTQRLRDRIELAMRGAQSGLDAVRLEQEVALFADRADISEELTRFRSHCNQFRDIVNPTDTKPVGRRLDFLLQEMGREINTLGAKSADADISRCVVELKAELERMREQVQNVV